MEFAIDIVSAIALATGGFVYAVGAFGLNRMPDLFSRMHAVSVSDTLGIGLLIFGMVLQAGATLIAAKLVIIVLVIWATGPVATHALARAALHAGHKPLLVDGDGNLVETDPVDLFPELGVRLATPTTSETLIDADSDQASDRQEESEPEETLVGYGLDEGSETNPDARPPEQDPERDDEEDRS